MNRITTTVLVSFAAATTASAAPIADSRLHVLEHGHFVITDEAAPKTVKLHLLQPMSYDNTSIADATDLDKPHPLTLLSDAGSCTVETTKRVFLSTWSTREAKVALDLDLASCKLEHPVLVVDGTTDATAELPANETRSSTSVVRWFELTTGKTAAVGYDKQPSVYVQPIGEDVAAVTGTFADGGQILVVRRGETALARFPNSRVFAILHDHGDRLIIATPKGLRSVAL